MKCQMFVFHWRFVPLFLFSLSFRSSWFNVLESFIFRFLRYRRGWFYMMTMMMMRLRV